MTTSLRKTRLQAIVPTIALGVAVLLGGGVWLAGQFDSQSAAAQATLGALARATSLNVARIYDGARQSLRRSESVAAPDASVPSPPGLAIIDRDLRQRIVGQSHDVDVSDRDYARALAGIEEGAIYPGAPLIDAQDGTPHWPLSLRAANTAGVAGLVRNLSLDDVQRPLEAVRIKPDGQAWLIREDGTVLAVAPWRADLIGQNLAIVAPALMQRAGTERMIRTPIDDQPHLVVVAAVPGLPLRVAIAAPAGDFLVEWWREAGLLAALMTVMLATSAYAARRHLLLLGQLERANAALQQQVKSQSAVLDAEIRGRQEHERLARLLRNALEYSGTMVLIADAAGLIEYANPAFYQATGYQPDDIVGKPPSVLRHPQLSPRDASPWPSLLAGQSWTGMFCNRRRDGSPLWVSATISPVSDTAGMITHFVAVEEDATSRRVGEEELREAKRAAEAASLAKSEFLSSMSHELRTPMNAILGFAQLLANSDDVALGERQRFYADSILKSGNHLLSLVNDILDMARIEAGRLSLSFEPVALDRLVAEIKPMIAPLAERRKITLVDEITGKEAPLLEADFTRLKQVLINLASNAVKYNRSGGSVRLSVSHGDSGPIRVAVSDTGIGIPEKRRSEVFVPFSRLGAEASTVEGTGIGLTISKMLVEAMGGQIGFFTQENLGTTFWLEIPRATRQTAPAPQVGDTAPTQDQAHCRCQMTLLYIEDNPSNVELMEEILAQDPECRCQLICAGNAEDGLALARRHRPGLMIMDVNLPGINGIEAVARMKADPELCAIPVIALSADVMPDTIRNGMKAGFLRYLRKPLDIGEFRKLLNQVGQARG